MMLTSTASWRPASAIPATKASWIFMEPAKTQAVPAQTETRRRPSGRAETPTLTPCAGAGAASGIGAASLGQDPLEELARDLAGLVGGEVAEGLLVDAHDGRLRAGAHAGDRVQRELPVGAGLAVGHL